MTARRIDELKIDLEPLGHALSDNVLAVPLYQRSYAWEQAHVLDLYQDITTALSDKEKDYFVGSIVVTKGANDRLDVVDGQQRLASTVILIAAMRDWFEAGGDKNRADQLEQSHLVNFDFRTQERLPRLQMNEVDNQFFLQRILSAPGSTERRAPASTESHRKIAAAAQLARTHIEHWVKTSSKPTERLIELKDYLDQHVQVIWVRVPDDANAFVIFETLNDRGLELAISDLLKNYLFRMADNRLPEVQREWVAMLATLEAVNDESIVVEFIRHLWSSIHGSTRERDLYAAIKSAASSKQATVDLANELSRSARLYAAILNTDNPFWSDYGATAKGHMSTMNMLGMVQIRPLLLAVLSKLSVKEVRKTIRLMVSWGVRFLITGGLGGGTMEKHYSDAAQQIRSGKITSAAGLARFLSDVIPRDKEFEAALAVARVSKANLARYYLQVMERQQSGASQPELVPNTNQDEVSIEHILPQNPDNTWTHLSDEEAAAYRTRLGNLALLSSGMNGSIGNASFATKRAVLARSSFALTKSAAKPKIWGTKQIEDRQRKLAELGVKAWPLK